jgi:hypothetical protein
MPKLELRLKVGRTGEALSCTVLDQGRTLPGHPVAVEHRAGRLVLQVPSALLGGPDRLLVEARASGERALDLLSWRVVDLAPGDEPARRKAADASAVAPL